MTDRYASLTVALDHDIREDDANAIINAICMLKGVLSVHGNVTSPNDYAIATRERVKCVRKLQALSSEILNDKD